MKLWLLLLGVLLAVALAVLAAWAIRKAIRARRRRRLAARPRYPVVLAHGLLGFDELRILRTRHAYFRKVAQRLESHGWEVHRPVVPRAGSIETRAKVLAARIDELGAKRVNVVAHSMGGLDARYAIARLGLGPRVASLVTVGTPHRGTPLADTGTSILAMTGLKAALTLAGVDVDAFWDLTSARMQVFNREVEDVPGVHYASVVGQADRDRHLNPLLLPSYLFLAEKAGDNDGLVPSSSQRWGEVLSQIEADHFAQVGWSRRFDAPAFYEELLLELRGRGF